MKEMIGDWVNWSLTTWQGLPLVVQALILTMVFVSAVVEGIKRSFFMSLPKTKRKAWIWRTSMLIGITCGITGYALYGGKIHVGYWIFIGGCSGPAANCLHWLTMTVVWPWIHGKFKGAPRE